MIFSIRDHLKKYLHKCAVFLFYALSIFFVCSIVWILVVYLVIENQDVYAVAPKNMQWVEVGANNIAYQYFSADTNKNVLLIGGTTAWSGVWAKTIEDLKGIYNIYAIDLPPFGYSVVDKEYKYNLQNQANTINGFVEEMNLKDVVVVAHSYGAGPTMEAVLKNTGAYNKLVIIDGAIHVDGSPMPNNMVVKTFFKVPVLRYLVATFALHAPGFMEASLKYLVHDNSSVSESWVGIYNQPLRVENQSQKTGKWFYDFVFENGSGLSSDSKNYKALSVPVNIVWGKEDNLTPLNQGLYLKEIIPGSTMIQLDGVGHIPMIDNHNVFIEVLKKSIK